MSNSIETRRPEYSEFYGRLEFLPRRDYFRGSWRYVASEDLPDGRTIDIVRSEDNSDWRYTFI